MTAMTALRVDGQVLDGQILYLDADWQTLYVKMAEPTSTADAFAILRRAHKFAMSLDSDEPLVSGTRVVETWLVPPGGQDFHNHRLVAGTWIAALRFNDAADWPTVAAQLDGDAQNIAQKGKGGDSMDAFGTAVREKREPLFPERRHVVSKQTFSETIRATLPQATHEVVDAELVRVVRQAVDEALRPLLFQMQEIDSRIRRVITGIQSPPNEDPFGAAVRLAPLTAAEKADAAKRRAEDAFGAAVREKRPPLVLAQGHRFLRDKRRR